MEITEIKQQLTIDQVLNHYHLKPDRNNMLHCPFHDDKTPSLQIYPKTNTFCCFSSNCNAGTGDVIDFIQLKEKCNKHEALMQAKQMLGVTGNTNEGQQLSRIAPPQMSRASILTKFYDSCLQGIGHSKQAKAYLSERGLTPQKTGFASGTIPAKWNNNFKQQAAAIGLLKKSTRGYVHHFKNCIVFPLLDQQGKVVSLYGRRIELNGSSAGLSDRSETKTGAKSVGRHVYLPGERQGLYPKYPPAETESLILTESIIDAASLPSGYTALALYGTNGLTKEHEEVISTLPNLKEIILFMDGDAAGRKAVEKLKTTLEGILSPAGGNRKGAIISAVDTPEDEDINSLAVNHQGDEEELFKHLIDQRIILSKEKSSHEMPKEAPIKNQQSSILNTANPELLHYSTATLCITILGGIKITGLDRLRVTLKIENMSAERLLPIRHSLDLYHSKQVGDLVQQISEQYELSRQEIQHIIAALTGALEDYRHSRLEAMKPKKPEKKQLTPVEEKAALDYLKDPQLMINTLRDIKTSGIIGEERNAMIAFIAYLSRKREKPLHIMCLGASGSGKTYLQEKIGELIPEEDKLEITMLSENAFYYFGKEELKHKLILIEDLDGAENVLYPLRELQSKRRISKTVTLKDNKGNLKTMTLKVEGPVCVSSCTTREKVYEDNANRCILLYIDTGKAQDKRITAYQRAESAGQINRHVETEIKEKFKNIQRLLRPIKVVNPYAQFIDLPEEVFKPRRTMILLLSFIETITFYHQHQREVKFNNQTTAKSGQAGERYIEATCEDVEKGFNLLRDVLFSKSDELSGACRHFFERLKKHTGEAPFYTREIRKAFRINPSNLKRYMIELSRFGYVQVTGGSKYKGYQYQVGDYKEYEQLKTGIDKKLDEILLKIRNKPAPMQYRGGSVVHSGSNEEMNHSTY